MEQTTAVIRIEGGLHARPASILVNKAKTFASRITLTNAAKQADAKSIIGLMGLATKSGDEIIIIAEGEDEFAAVQEIKQIIENGFQL
ncbi:MAG TPA: HPr family phosphocarrier protein [Bacilli bacterium]